MAEGSKFKFILKRTGNLNDPVYAKIELKSGSASPDDDYVNALYSYENGVFRGVWGGSSPTITFKPGQSVVDLYVFIRDNKTVNVNKTLYVNIKEAGGSSDGSEVLIPNHLRKSVVTIKDDDKNYNPFVNDAVLRGFSKQTVAAGAFLSLKLPDNLFIDPEGKPLGHNAFITGGAPLPDWMEFKNNTFSGIAPILDEKYSITVTAYDDDGGFAHTQFDLAVSPQTSGKVVADVFRGAVGSGIPTALSGDSDGWHVEGDFGDKNGHLGEDWNMDIPRGKDGSIDRGADVRSIAPGYVEKISDEESAKNPEGWGHYIVIRHPLSHAITVGGDTFENVYSIYAHLQEKPNYVIGNVVKSGEIIGHIGNTGNSSNYHLHFGITTSQKSATKAGYSSAIAGGIFSENKEYFTYKDGGSNHYYLSPRDFINEYNSGSIWAESKDVSYGFSALAYEANNRDLSMAYSGDVSKLIQHYISYGRSERRTASGFDAVAYAANNPDLYKAFGSNQKALVSHYINVGKAEGRKATGFSAYAYAAKNKDLLSVYQTNADALLNHYITYGKLEKREATGFDPYSYAAKNKDLLQVYGTDEKRLMTHYADYGMLEGRSADGFNAYAYAAKNPDLFSAFGVSVDSLVRHYSTYGAAEGRLAS